MRLLALCLALLTVAGCDSASESDASRADVVAAQAAFARTRPADYTLQYELRCECIGGATVTVRGGEVVSATGPGASRASTVEDLFETALLVFEAGGTGSVRLSDSEPRIPVRIDLNPESAPMDGNVLLIVTRFHID